MNIILIIIIMLTLFIPFLLYMILKTKDSNKNVLNQYCDTDKDCPENTKCVNDEDYNKKICSTKKYCSVENNNLTKCLLNDKNFCKNSCNNQLQFKCQEVTDENPYVIQNDGQIIKIKNSEKDNGWCLPDLNKSQSVKCNKYTADDIIVKNPDNSFKWGCNCTTNLFTHSDTPTSDCITQLACQNIDGTIKDLYIKDDPEKSCNNQNKNVNCLSKENSRCFDNDGNIINDNTNGFCYSKWTPESISNPLYGACDCDPGMKTIRTIDGFNSVLMCVKDQCYPGFLSNPDPSKCNCDNILNGKYISCKDINDPTLRNKIGCSIEDKCIKDTCINGSYNIQTQLCDCNDGFINKSPYNNLLNTQCVPICGPENNPCGSRGTCYIDKNEKEDDKKAKCECVRPYVQANDNDFHCTLRMQDTGDQCYLNNECYSGICTQNIFSGFSFCE